MFIDLSLSARSLFLYIDQVWLLLASTIGCQKCVPTIRGFCSIYYLEFASWRQAPGAQGRHIVDSHLAKTTNQSRIQYHISATTYPGTAADDSYVTPPTLNDELTWPSQGFFYSSTSSHELSTYCGEPTTRNKPPFWVCTLRTLVGPYLLWFQVTREFLNSILIYVLNFCSRTFSLDFTFHNAGCDLQIAITSVKMF